MYHFRKTRKRYNKHNKADKNQGGCTFCNDDDERAIKSAKTMLVAPNRVKYDIFEGREVLDHLLIIPKRHVESLNDFTKEEKLEMMDIAGEYEAKGYNVYARGVGSSTRSVKHQHTHLIKIRNDKKPKIYLVIGKPYFLFHK